MKKEIRLRVNLIEEITTEVKIRKKDDLVAKSLDLDRECYEKVDEDRVRVLRVKIRTISGKLHEFVLPTIIRDLKNRISFSHILREDSGVLYINISESRVEISFSKGTKDVLIQPIYIYEKR